MGACDEGRGCFPGGALVGRAAVGGCCREGASVLGAAALLVARMETCLGD